MRFSRCATLLTGFTRWFLVLFNCLSNTIFRLSSSAHVSSSRRNMLQNHIVGDWRVGG